MKATVHCPRARWLALPAALLCVVVAAAAQREPVPTASVREARTFSREITRTFTLDYLLYLPAGYEAAGETAWPLVLFLHGAGERGSELERVKVNGLPRRIDEGREYPFIVVSPQCPQGERWSNPWMVDGLATLLGALCRELNVDEDRIYLTGLSMGGSGTWALAARYPDLFAAAAPVCGGAVEDAAYRIRRIPIWVFHGAEDDVVPVTESQAMVAALTACHGDVRSTIYPDTGHDAWTATYDNPELYAWFLQQRRASSPAIPLHGVKATASSGDATRAVDGDVGSRWESAWSDPQWLMVDLGAPAPLRRLLLYWEAAFARSYDVLCSLDGETWDTVCPARDGDGAVDLVDFPAGLEARYVKIMGRERGTAYGYSLWELELE